MINGLGKELNEVRKVISNEVNEVVICKDMAENSNHEYYTLIRIHDSDKIKDVLEVVYKEDGSCNFPQHLFCGIFVDVDVLNILLYYREPRKLFSYLKSEMKSEYIQQLIIQNFLLECFSLNITNTMLNLFLEEDNINIDGEHNVYFDGFIDFAKLDKNISEQICVKKCSNIINDIILSNEQLSDNSSVKSIGLFRKKRRNNHYTKLIQLYNDFKIKERVYRDRSRSIWARIIASAKELYKEKFEKIVAVLGTIVIVTAIGLVLSNLFNLKMPFTKYKGLNTIGIVNMMERK